MTESTPSYCRYVDCIKCGDHCILGWDEKNKQYIAICERCKRYDNISNVVGKEKPHYA